MDQEFPPLECALVTSSPGSCDEWALRGKELLVIIKLQGLNPSFRYAYLGGPTGNSRQTQAACLLQRLKMSGRVSWHSVGTSVSMDSGLAAEKWAN